MRWGMPPRGGGFGGGGGSYNILGVFILKPIAWLMAAVVFMSAFGSLLQRSGIPLLEYSVLTVAGVFRGEIWRLVTWAPIELSPLGLLFGCLLLYFIGPDLVRRWGTRRFFVNYFGGAAVVGTLTCLVGGFLWADVARFPYTGLWPMEEAMIIASFSPRSAASPRSCRISWRSCWRSPTWTSCPPAPGCSGRGSRATSASTAGARRS
jgi:hypothetical protein